MKIDYENLAKANQRFEEDYRQSFDNFLAKGWYILGEQVKLFEQEFAEYCGSKFCIGLASGLDALILSLVALELPKGSKVLVPSNTYIATILSILNAGLEPVLVEPISETYNLNPELLEQHIDPSVKAIMVVHLYGSPCEMDKIMQVADRYKLYVIEDCAQAQGASYNDIKAGNWGTFGAHSFYPTKNLGCLGDGGAITTNDEAYSKKLRALRNYGSFTKYYNEYIGINSRLDEVQAGFLRIKLKALDEINQHKNQLADLYLQGLKLDGLVLPVRSEKAYEVFHIFPVRHPQRDLLRKHLEERGIKTEIHYPVAPHRQVAYTKFFEGQSFPVSEEIHATELSLPISFCHTPEEISYVISAINEFQSTT